MDSVAAREPSLIKSLVSFHDRKGKQLTRIEITEDAKGRYFALVNENPNVVWKAEACQLQLRDDEGRLLLIVPFIPWPETLVGKKKSELYVHLVRPDPKDSKSTPRCYIGVFVRLFTRSWRTGRGETAIFRVEFRLENNVPVADISWFHPEAGNDPDPKSHDFLKIENISLADPKEFRRGFNFRRTNLQFDPGTTPWSQVISSTVFQPRSSSVNIGVDDEHLLVIAYEVQLSKESKLGGFENLPEKITTVPVGPAKLIQRATSTPGHWLMQVDYEVRHDWLLILEAQFLKKIREALRFVAGGQPLSFIPSFAPNQKGLPAGRFLASYYLDGEWESLQLDEQQTRKFWNVPSGLRASQFEVFSKTQETQPSLRSRLLSRLKPQPKLSGKQPADSANATKFVWKPLGIVFQPKSNLENSVGIEFPHCLNAEGAPLTAELAFHSPLTPPLPDENNPNPKLYFKVRQLAGDQHTKSTRVNIAGLCIEFDPRDSTLETEFCNFWTENDIPCVELDFTLGAAAVSPQGEELSASGPPPTHLGANSIVFTPPPREEQDRNPTTHVVQVVESMRSRQNHKLTLALRQLSGGPQGAVQKVVLRHYPFRVTMMEYTAKPDYAGTNEVANYSSANGSWRLGSGLDKVAFYLPPQAVAEETVDNEATDLMDNGKERLSSVRFSPNAKLSLPTHYFDSSFGEAPWNIDRLVGESGQRDPGATLNQIDFELFYGLSGRIFAIGWRLCEMGALMGSLPGNPVGHPTDFTAAQGGNLRYTQFAGQWKILERAYSSRLAMWGLRAPGRLDFSAPLKEGLSYRVRQNARMDQAEGSSEASPFHGGLAAAAGDFWGEELKRVSGCLEAEVQGLFFSALGGWGRQSVQLTKNFRILTESSQGRVHTIITETTGRISIGWNLAKKVDVWQRSVLPGDDINTQAEPRQGRALVRKVESYIEILEPVGELAKSGDPRIVGPIRSLEFPEQSRKISVKGIARATSIEDGFQIPLWQENFIPKPQIVLNLAGANGSQVRADLVRPDKIYFYVRDLTTPPSTWGPKEGLDYPETAEVSKPTWKAEKPSEATEFHFELSRADGAVNLNQGRFEQPCSTELKSVILIRGSAIDRDARLLLAKGSPPDLPQLDFVNDAGAKLSSLNYYFNETRDGLSAALSEVHFSPSFSKVSFPDLPKAAPFGLKMPVISLRDKLQPPIDSAALAEAKDLLDFSKLFPKFAGLDIVELFPGIKLPDEVTLEKLPDYVKVSHGADPNTRRGWLEVDIDLQLPKEPVYLFQSSSAAVSVKSARFRGHSRLDGDAGGSQAAVSSGDISGDWSLQVLDTELLVISQTALSFDQNGRLKFDLDPKKISFPGALQFLAEMAAQFPTGSEESGVSFTATPSSALCKLNIPVPAITTGAFAIVGLNFGFHFGLEFGKGLAVLAGFQLSSQKTPFILTICSLGGSGWLSFRCVYRVAGKLEVELGLALAAAAAVNFEFGPVSGGVSVSFGIQATYMSEKPSPLAIGIYLNIHGSVDICGIVTVDINITLEATYETGGKLRGRGTLEVSVDISWFYTFEYSDSIEYVMDVPASDHDAMVEDYYNCFSEDC